MFYILKTFRLYYKGNIRNVIIAGSGDSIEELRAVFTKKKELGYNVKGVFNNSKDGKTTGTISDCFNFLETNTPSIQNLNQFFNEWNSNFQ